MTFKIDEKDSVIDRKINLNGINESWRNYRENFFYSENMKLLLLKPDVIIKIGDTNNCQICNAYKGMDIKEEQ